MIFNIWSLYLLLRFMVCRPHESDSPYDDHDALLDIHLILNYDSVTICDGMEKVVRCPNKENIHVLQGFYGKWKNHDCNGITIDPNNAHTCSKDRKETTAKVRTSCQGKNQCTFEADKILYGEPCPDSNAYLYVTFFCMEPGKKVDHHRDSNNQETVTVTTHGYLVSEKKHKPVIVFDLQSKEIARTSNDISFVDKGIETKTQQIESKLDKPKKGKEVSFGISVKLPLAQVININSQKKDNSVNAVVTPVRDERKSIPSQVRISNNTNEVTVRREEIYYRMLRSSTICNGQSKLIACLPEEGIKVNSAFYGKKTGKDCNGELPYKDDSPTCSALDAKSNVQSTCNGKQTCLLFADENIFGKSLCPNVNKYLHLDYVCLPISELSNIVSKKIQPIPVEDLEEDAVSRSTEPAIEGKQNLTLQVCNGERHAISCKRDVGMQIVSAFYGKINGRDCRGDLEYRDDIPDCNNPRALDSVKFLCENRKSCELASEKELFGDDMCPGVNKYLRVTYQC